MSEIISTLTEPFKYDFFNKAMVAAVLVGGLCGVIGVYVVLRRMSYIGHGLSHSIFGGAVVSYVLQLNFYIGAGAWGFLSAIIINAIARRRKVSTDAAIGIVTTASFALGVAIISKSRSFTKNFEAALFGNILGIKDGDLWVIGGVTLAVGLLIFLIYKQLLFSTFDPEVAPVYGVPALWIDSFFALALAGTIIVSMQILGVTLIAASLIIPPIVARLMTDSFHKMMGYSIFIGVLSSTVGLYLSYLLDVASGASIVLFGALLFVVVLAFGAIGNRLLKAKQPKYEMASNPLGMQRNDPAHDHLL